MAAREDDAELLQRWQGGDGRAGEVLVERYFDPIYRFFHTKLEAEADELVQSTFLACLAAKDRFRGASSFRTFLYGIARNQLFAALRGRQRAGALLELDASSIADIVSTPRTVLARNQDYARLGEALRRLPVNQQTVLELHYWEELEIGQLAEIFEAPEVTIRSRLFRAREALREQLQAESLEQLDAWARALRDQRS